MSIGILDPKPAALLSSGIFILDAQHGAHQAKGRAHELVDLHVNVVGGSWNGAALHVHPNLAGSVLLRGVLNHHVVLWFAAPSRRT